MKYLKWFLSFASRTVNIIFVVGLLISLSASYINPQKIWFMPFVSMLLPFFLIVNFIFVFIWLWRKRYFFMVSALAIATCLPQICKVMATNIGKTNVDVKQTNRIKVMSYNVRDFDLYNWSENVHSKEKIFNTIKEKNPDIISFQEFYNDTSAEFNTIKKLQALGYTHYYFTRELVLRNTDEWGIATFSKYPIVNYGAILQQQFSTSYGKKPHKGLYVDVAIHDTIIRVVNVHLQSIYFGSKDYETIAEFKETQNLDEDGTKSIFYKLKKAFIRRASQADRLKTFLDNQKLPVIVCGDFNDLPNSYVANTISKDRKDAFLESSFGIGSTYNGKIPFLRIDYLLCSPSFSITNFEVVDNKISDHFPVYGEFYLDIK